MQPWVTSPSFTVEPQSKADTDKFMPKGGWGSTVPPVSPWTVGSDAPVIPQSYQSDDKLKKLYGIELAKSSNAFDAACKLFGEETSKALWVSANWVSDPLVIASRDTYLKSLDLSSAPLDREQLAAKVLKLADGEPIERNGVKVPTIEAKDRIAAFKLYSDILGYTGKVEIDNSVNNNVINNNEITVKLVKADDKQTVKVIDNTPNIKSEITNEVVPINLKLVKAG